MTGLNGLLTGIIIAIVSGSIGVFAENRRAALAHRRSQRESLRPFLDRALEEATETAGRCQVARRRWETTEKADHDHLAVDPRQPPPAQVVEGAWAGWRSFEAQRRALRARISPASHPVATKLAELGDALHQWVKDLAGYSLGHAMKMDDHQALDHDDRVFEAALNAYIDAVRDALGVNLGSKI